VGKTHFIQRLRGYIEKGGQNTIYDYSPTNDQKNFHDNYRNQNIVIHEELGQGGEHEWAPYIPIVGSNPYMMNAAAVDKKGMLFFKSQVILATTNIDLCRKTLRRSKDCGWTDDEAIYRRALIVNFKRNQLCNVQEYNLDEHRYVPLDRLDANGQLQRVRVHTDKPDQFMDVVKMLWEDSLDNHKKLVAATQANAGFNYAFKMEGRVVKPKDNTQLSLTTDVPTVYERLIEYSDHTEKRSFFQEEQQVLIEQGFFINGAQEVVGDGPVFISKSIDEWWTWLKTKSMEKLESVTNSIREWSDKIITKIKQLVESYNSMPEDVKMLIDTFVALAALIGVGTGLYFLCKPKDKVESYQSTVHWAKPMKKMTAKDLFSESHPRLKCEPAPSVSTQKIQRNMLKAYFTYGTTSIYGYALALDCNTIITTAHLLLFETMAPDRVFVRATDYQDREIVSAYFTPKEWNVHEDVVTLKYTNPHAEIFKSISNDLVKTPSNKQLYLITTDGVVSIGEMDKISTIAGAYNVRDLEFKFDQAISHSYDGTLQSAVGLCGAVVATHDGYLVGMHCAGSRQGRGVARIWSEKVKNVVYECTNSGSVPVKETSSIKGAIELDTKEFHYVRLKTGLVESSMASAMRENKILCPHDDFDRAPARLGGTVEENGVPVRTYDRSRLKNLKTINTQVNKRALDFAKKYIHKLITKVMGKKIRVLKDDEIVNGFKNEDGILKPMNKEASSGVHFPGLVEDYIKDGRIDSRVKDHMSRVEAELKKGRKTWDQVKVKDCDKDEMRNRDKIDKPRCFAAGPIHFTMLIRKYFGVLCARIMKTRLKTGICIGINATSREWHDLWKKLVVHPNHFDGDYEMWDGAMRREFQEELNEVLAHASESPEIALGVLSHLYETTHVGMDVTYMTTHSIPSGHGMTSVYNSLINKMYVAYAWYILVGSSYNVSDDTLIVRMDSQLYVPVYGDDIVFSVHPDIAKLFNAISYARIMDDLQIGFTMANKKRHTREFTLLRDITFLKRSFYAHREFNCIAGPLELSVLRSTCAYTHDKARDYEITTQKMDSIQRELYIHPPEVYNMVWSALLDSYEKTFNVKYEGLSREDMYNMYMKGELMYDKFDLIGEGGEVYSLPTRRSSRRLVRWR
jgi:hypothetical protein